MKKEIHSKHVILGESWIVLIKNELNIPDAQLFSFIFIFLCILSKQMCLKMTICSTATHQCNLHKKFCKKFISCVICRHEIFYCCILMKMKIDFFLLCYTCRFIVWNFSSYRNDTLNGSIREYFYIHQNLAWLNECILYFMQLYGTTLFCLHHTDASS